MAKKTMPENPALKNFNEACSLIADHPIFAPLSVRASIIHNENTPYPEDGWALSLITAIFTLIPNGVVRSLNGCTFWHIVFFI
ncbi:hypothetical protein MHH52_13845 [Paenibacillus sp. FSL K6-0276]|uniref:hypothetical protein n=1 Tax=Paenibacillus sp. FSL K6-0276 TaxID=2921450 RepID=UPI0030EE807B